MSSTSLSKLTRDADEAPPRTLLLLTVLPADRADDLPDFLAWYRGMGVMEFHLILQGDWSQAARASLDAPDIKIDREIGGTLTEARVCAEITAAARWHEGNWCILAMAGERLVLPLASPAETIAAMQELGIDDLHARRIGPAGEVGVEKTAYPLCRIGPSFRYQAGNRLPPNGRPVAHLPLRGVLQTVAPGIPAEECAVLSARARLVAPSEADRTTLRELAAARSRVLAKRIRICFITFEISEARHVGGIATAMTGLAKLLVAQGFAIDVIYCPWSPVPVFDPVWVEHYRAQGISLHYCPIDGSLGGLPGFRQRLMAMVEALGPIDILHVHEAQGYAAWFLERRLLMAERPAPAIVLTLHGGTRWHHESNGTNWNERDYRRELAAIRMCDMAISPSRYMLDWYRRHGAVAPNSCVLPNVLAPEGKSFAARADMLATPRTVAFFGRLEQRKGIRLFIAALRHLAADHGLAPPVIFVGAFGLGYAREELETAMAEVPVSYEIISNADPLGAMELLLAREAIAVAPSLRENAPYVVYECAEAQIPLLTTAPGGTPEILAEEVRGGVIVAADPVQLAGRLAAALAGGAPRARLAFPALGVEREHARLWESLQALKVAPLRPPATEQLSLADVARCNELDPELLVWLTAGESGITAQQAGVLGLLLLQSGAEIAIANAGFEGGEGGPPDALAILETDAEGWPARLPLLPIIAPAGVLAVLARDAAGSPEQVYRAMLRAAASAGRRVLCPAVQLLTMPRPPRPAPPPRAEQPPAKPRKPEKPATYPLNAHDYMRCALISREPFVALSMFTPACPWGSLPLAPANRRSLHLVHFDYSVLGRLAEIRTRCLDARDRWPNARVVVLASDREELHALRAGGIDAIIGNLGMFSDETVFTSEGPASPAGAPLYIAPMIPGKCHELAARLPEIALICSQFPGMEDREPQVRQILPQARFVNENPDGKGFSWVPEDRLAQWMRGSRAGLFLSTEDGCCPESVQFLLCGIPVVSVRNRGGRDHFLTAPFAREVAPDADDVLRGCLAIEADRPMPGEIRAHALARLAAARDAFAAELEDITRHWLGAGIDMPLNNLMGVALRYRRFGAVLGSQPAAGSATVKLIPA